MPILTGAPAIVQHDKGLLDLGGIQSCQQARIRAPVRLLLSPIVASSNQYQPSLARLAPEAGLQHSCCSALSVPACVPACVPAASHAHPIPKPPVWSRLLAFKAPGVTAAQHVVCGGGEGGAAGLVGGVRNRTGGYLIRVSQRMLDVVHSLMRTGSAHGYLLRPALGFCQGFTDTERRLCASPQPDNSMEFTHYCTRTISAEAGQHVMCKQSAPIRRPQPLQHSLYSTDHPLVAAKSRCIDSPSVWHSLAQHREGQNS